MSTSAWSYLARQSAAVVVVAAAFVGCFAEPPKGRPLVEASGATDATGGAAEPASAGDGAGGAMDGPAPVCKPARGDSIPPRVQVISAEAQPSEKLIFTSDLFSKFKSYCGGCHVDANLGGFASHKVTQQNFAVLVDQVALDRIHSNDPTQVMPPLGQPGSKLWQDRTPEDGLLQFAGQLEAWIAAGRPADLFTQKPEASDGASPYLLSEAVGMGMTNIGNCIPNRAGVATDVKDAEALDAAFENATELPQQLQDTDLTTLDAEVLSRKGVVAFAPGYPLWSDNAKKLRQVRVPRGTSIRFDKAKQSFEIPANTRFYKTFLKEVIDTDGNKRYRKIETRLIVSRPDACTRDDQGEHCTPQALMGSYKWNDDETAATLVQDPYYDGTPFADLKFTYITDEKKAAKVKNPEQAGLTRHYAIPGHDRCVHCHRGAVNKSTILGFLPLQLKRRPKGEGGVIEDSNEDELSQLQRFIDYGVITGMDSPDDVTNLEDSQKQPPRNDSELVAQGYMLGNCAHCHNPRGYPSLKNPELASLLDFFPNMDGGGIFQFPLDRVSPRLHRGADASDGIPYITPSLLDAPSGAQDGIYTDKSTFVLDPQGQSMAAPILAPWRSLIYRNVDTPFTYSDDYAIFPHMPFDTAGYDCRAPRIMGDWMVSIPAHTKTVELYNPISFLTEPFDADTTREPQPYEEVKPSDPFFSAATEAAKQRVEQYHGGYRYDFCPDTSDVVDPLVESGAAIVPPDTGYPSVAFPSILVKDGVPDRAHWVVTDTTQVPGDWVPRRSDYADVLLAEAPLKYQDLTPDKKAVTHIVGLGDQPGLKPLSLSANFKDFALHRFPMTLWQQKPGCEDALKQQPVSADFTDPERNPDAARDSLPWLTRVDAPAADAAIYTTSPGAMVFEQICRNCHGPDATGASTLADTILTLTGGKTRVADLRDGLLGPLDEPGANREAVFAAKAKTLNLTSDDLAGRYLAWMALGGTEKPIPPAALITVSNTKVFGESREYSNLVFPRPPPATGNMLASARWLCATLVKSRVGFDIATGDLDADTQSAMPFVRSNGDAAIWRQLCYWDNPGPVRVIVSDAAATAASTFAAPKLDKAYAKETYRRPSVDYDSYPAGNPVGGPGGVVYPSWDDANPTPWCIRKPTAENQVNLDEYWQKFAHDPSAPIPYCPDALLNGPEFPDDDVNPDVRNWAIRGAANAGLSVFVYLDAVARGLAPKVGYDQCDKLLASGM